jgi:hypothetical protein
VEGYDLEEARTLILMAARNIDVMPTNFAEGPEIKPLEQPALHPLPEVTPPTGAAESDLAQQEAAADASEGVKATAAAENDEGKQQLPQNVAGQERSVPEVTFDALHTAARYLVWRNFHTIPDTEEGHPLTGKNIKKGISTIEAGAKLSTALSASLVICRRLRFL